MRHEPAIVNPYPGKKARQLGPTAVMIATEPDIADVAKRLGKTGKDFTQLMLSRLYRTGPLEAGGSFVGPLIGAPYAAMILETLIARGAQTILFFGWCGALIPDVQVGDIIVPTGALIDEGTSRHYAADPADPVLPSQKAVAFLQTELKAAQIDFRTGMVWSTDGVFRETPTRIAAFRERGAVAVEMEVSALFSVARFRKVEVAAVLVVSDELSTDSWRPGFRDTRFSAACGDIRKIIAKICF